MTAGYIRSVQPSLFGQPDVVGFGDDAFRVVEISRDLANRVIVENHYSRKFYAASYVHLGVFIDAEMVGVLQFGYAMNPASADSVVAGTAMSEYLELNRMWLDDVAPRNSESRAIACAIRFIRWKLPKIKWIQSFSDERCGLFGTVYQASGFTYHGEHSAIFWTLDGQVYHNSLMTRSPELSKAAAHLIENKDRATSETLRQFRYLKFLKPRFAKGCRHPALPYPKPDYAARPEDERPPRRLSTVQPRGAAPIEGDAA